jgi:hypothetical protein
MISANRPRSQTVYAYSATQLASRNTYQGGVGEVLAEVEPTRCEEVRVRARRFDELSPCGAA